MILITGGAGYIGSHINKLLSTKGHSTLVYDNLVYGHKESLKWGQFIQGDLADREKLEELFRSNTIEAVIHLAAYAYVGESVFNPAKYYNNNVINTIILLDAMIKHGCKKIVFSSSCTVYGIPSANPITEGMPKNPISPYGRTKHMVEMIVEDYARAYGLKYAILRYFNAAGADPECEIGESHNPETHLIPLVLDAAANGTVIKVFGSDYPTPDGTCIRDYIHVADLADAHLKAYSYLDDGDNVFLNLGNDKGYSVLEIIKLVKNITGEDIRIEYINRRSGDPAELVGSYVRANEVLGWKPKYNIEEIVKHAWNWYQKAIIS